MDRVSTFERRLGEAARVAGIARTLEAVHDDQVRGRLSSGTLRVGQHLDVRRGTEIFRLDREPLDIQASRPIIAGDGQEMGIREQRYERIQIPILE